METLIIACIIVFTLSLNVKAEDITELNTLIENAKEMDGQEVTVQGEVIGERMDRGDYSWININDGTNAMGIWLSKSEAEKVLNYGNYKYKGDTVKITGVFSRACAEHGGESDLHSNSIQVIEQGHRVNEQLSCVKIVSAIILAVVATLMLLGSLKFIKVQKRCKRNESLALNI